MLMTNFNNNWKVAQKGGQFGRTVFTNNKTVTLPHDAMISTIRKPGEDRSNKKGFFENGTWEYKKTFFVSEERRKEKTVFMFEGVYQRAKVHINGDFAIQHPYGYTPFTVDADPFLKYGQENEITVTVHTADDSRWYTGAGIYRDVFMLSSKLVYIKPYGTKIKTPEINENRAVVSVAVSIKNDGDEAKTTAKVITEIHDREGDLIATVSEPCTVLRKDEATLHQRLYVKNPKLWDVDSPNLYYCTTKVFSQDGEILDESKNHFGIRSLALDYENGFCLNGKVVKLMGSCIHHDNGALGAASIYDAEARRITTLKDAGFNAIRMSHHPASRALLDACDKIGMLVMNEAFDMWATSKSDFDYALDFSSCWEMDIEAMVNQSFNHPSVIMYSIGNEIQDTGSTSGAIWSRKLTNKIREMDSTRYITNGINGMVSVMELLIKMQKDHQAKQGGQEVNNMMAGLGSRMKQIMCMESVTKATEESFACLDIAGYNYMDSRYEMDQSLFPGRIIVGSETFPSDIDQNWRKVLDNGYIIGDFTWTGWDYIGEAGIGKVNYGDNIDNVYGSYPVLTAMTGDIAITGYRRPASFYREIIFRKRELPYIAVQRPEHYNDNPLSTPWSWSDSVSSWSFGSKFEGKPVKVEVYSQADEVELVINGIKKGRQPAGEANRFKAVFDTIYEAGEVVAVAIKNNIETGRFSLHTATGDLVLCAQPDKKQVRHDTDSLVFVDISLKSKNGNIFAYDNRKVRVKVEGAGELAGFANADPLTEENFFDEERSTYDGHALAIIRPIATGKISIIVSADSMEDVNVALDCV